MLPTLFLVLTSLLASVSGQTLWLTGTSGSWSTNANWQGGAAPLLGNLGAEISSLGTYTVSVDTTVSLSGALAILTLGSDIIAGVNPTLALNAGVSAYYETMNVANGATIQINAGASLWVKNLQFTAVNAANVVSGAGKLYVNGTLTYTASAGNLVLPVQVNTSGVTVGNGATVQLTSNGGCYGNSGAAGAINLGSGILAGGNVVVSGNFDLGNCMLSGTGNLTLNSSSAQTYVLATGTHAAGYVKAQGSSTLSLSGGGATTVAATLWIGGSAGRLVVAQANATTTTQVNGDVQLVAQGTSTAYVNSGFVVQGALWVGSDTISGVAPTVQVASGVMASATTLRLLTGGNAVVGANGGLTTTTVTVTGSSNTTNSVSGSGWFNVTGSFTAATTGATVQIGSPFALTGSLSVSNGATVVVTSNSGWSNGQINLGGQSNGGNLIVEGNWQHYVAPTGAGGNFTFSPSSTINYALVAGTYGVAWVKTQNDAHVWVVAAVTISGGLWIQDSARVTANQTLTVGQDIVVAGSGILEVAGADVTANADASFQSGSKYIIFAEDANPPKLMVNGAASLAGNIHIVSQFLVDGNDSTTVTVAEYASHTGTFGSVSAESTATVGTAQSLPMYTTSRRLLSSASYSVEYSSTNATAHRSGSNGAASLTPSVLLLGMMVAAMSFFVAL